jgi:predicted small integral membrane protein
LVMDLTNVMSCCFKVSRAAIAAFNAGMATANCSSHSSCHKKTAKRSIILCTLDGVRGDELFISWIYNTFIACDALAASLATASSASTNYSKTVCWC